MFKTREVHIFKTLETPFYYYQLDLLRETLKLFSTNLKRYNYQAHYALKANANDRILKVIKEYGLGADCVSGNEVLKAINMGFDPKSIVYAGVGKSDKEISVALENDIFSFNSESIPELEIINEIAASMNRVASVSLRINPDVDAHTHKYISTGRKEDKFGISPWMFCDVIEVLKRSKNIKLIGLHFHVGSQITDLNVFRELSTRVNEVVRWFQETNSMAIENINVGGGLGIDYAAPDKNPIASFDDYFEIFHKGLELRRGQRVHFEPGRAIVGQCGSLISRVLYVKVGKDKKFVILDAGMNDLIRPALYQASHSIQNLSSQERAVKYEVVGPVCESSDKFGKNISLPATSRGDLVALRSAGAYGQVMSMRYNLKEIAPEYYSDDFDF